MIFSPAQPIAVGRYQEIAYLIHPDGSIVHEFRYEQGFSWHYCEMLSNGNLLAIIKDKMIIEIDSNNELVWKYNGNVHHDFSRQENGNTYLITGRPDTLCEELAASCPIYLDYLEEVNPEGEVLWQWFPEDHITEMKAHVELPATTEFNDWPHINTVEVLPDNPSAINDNRFRSGNILLCGRHINTILIVDRESSKVVWAWGPSELNGPHMPTMLPTGKILIYDNGYNTASYVTGFTRILELDPLTEKVRVVYENPKNFYSPSRGSAEILPNGNCLIAHSDSGRLFEVTSKGEQVWEFLNDTRDKKGNRFPIYRTTHYNLDDIPQSYFSSLT
jgi:hypothetical protein